MIERVLGSSLRVRGGGSYLGPTCSSQERHVGGRTGSLAVMIRTLHLEARAGLWIALDDEDRVAASAPTVKDLMAKFDANGMQDVEIMHAPDPNEAIPNGLR